ncbi:hypothetical protein JHK82_030363 [Glycine max]|nr:hypothetical protein JHK82_030363 [Glycine max]
MALFSHHRHSYETLLGFLLFLVFREVSGATFTFVNKCDHTVWPGILGAPQLGSTGFELAKGGSKSFQAPTGWSGRFWGRTGCQFDGSGKGTCVTADCGSGEVNCNGAGASPPATLAEFTLGNGSMDYYDVSLVDGYNLPMMVVARGGSGSCAATGCGEDLNQRCPSELRVEGGDACQSACGAFGKPEYCCNGAFSNPSTCKPSILKSSTDSSPKGMDAGSGSGGGSSVEQSELASTSWLADMATATGASTRTRPFVASKIFYEDISGESSGWAEIKDNACKFGTNVALSSTKRPTYQDLAEKRAKVVTIDVRAAKSLIQTGSIYLDVRTVEEFKKGHVYADNVLNIPYMLNTPKGKVKNGDFLKEVSSACNKEDHLVVGCQSGVRSLYATADLLSDGFKNAKDMGGGYVDWVKNKFPVNIPEAKEEL